MLAAAALSQPTAHWRSLRANHGGGHPEQAGYTTPAPRTARWETSSQVVLNKASKSHCPGVQRLVVAMGRADPLLVIQHRKHKAASLAWQDTRYNACTTCSPTDRSQHSSWSVSALQHGDRLSSVAQSHKPSPPPPRHLQSTPCDGMVHPPHAGIHAQRPRLSTQPNKTNEHNTVTRAPQAPTAEHRTSSQNNPPVLCHRARRDTHAAQAIHTSHTPGQRWVVQRTARQMSQTQRAERSTHRTSQPESAPASTNPVSRHTCMPC